jgi:hypothetical protein
MECFWACIKKKEEEEEEEEEEMEQLEALDSSHCVPLVGPEAGMCCAPQETQLERKLLFDGCPFWRRRWLLASTVEGEQNICGYHM